MKEKMVKAERKVVDDNTRNKDAICKNGHFKFYLMKIVPAESPAIDLFN